MSHYYDQYEQQYRQEDERMLHKQQDDVNRPAHYTQFPVEVIEITEHLGFCIGNVVKYCCRAKFKGNELKDLEKAQWYLNREIERVKKERASKTFDDSQGFTK